MSSLSRALALSVALPLILATPHAAVAQNTAPMATPVPDNLPVARDIPYPGTIQLEVDVTDTARGIFKVRETIPVAQPLEIEHGSLPLISSATSNRAAIIAGASRSGQVILDACDQPTSSSPFSSPPSGE